MTIEKVRSRFESESILIEDAETNESLNVLGGGVVHHSHDRGGVYRKAVSLHPARSAVLCPMFDVLGTETNRHRDGRWRPMSDAEMLYRRAMCKGKPSCFLITPASRTFRQS